MNTAEAFEFVRRMRLGFEAVVKPDNGRSIAHSGTLAVFDVDHLIFADVALSHHLEKNANIIVEVADPFSRRGYRFRGNAKTVSIDNDAQPYVAFYESWGWSNVQSGVKNFVVIKVDYIEQLFSPSSILNAKESANAGRQKVSYENLWKF
jgi:hypothetical protein